MLNVILTAVLILCSSQCALADCVGDEFCSPDELTWHGFSPYDAIYDEEDKKRAITQLPQPEEMNGTEYTNNWSDRSTLNSPLEVTLQAKVWRISYVDALLKNRLSEKPPGVDTEVALKDLGRELPSYMDVLDAILSYNYNAFVAGGLVRDAIQNVDGRDVDFTFTMPDQSLVCLVKQKCWGVPRYNDTNGYFRFPKSGSRSVPLYMEGFNTAKTLHADLYRRDYTVNALYYDYRQKVVVDLSGMGVEDALNCRIRIPVCNFTQWVSGDIDDSFTRLWRYFSLRFKKCGGSTYDSDLDTKQLIVGYMVDLFASNKEFLRTTEYFFYKLLSDLYGEQYAQKYNEIKDVIVFDLNISGFDGQSIWDDILEPLIIRRPAVRDIPTDKITFSQSTISISLSSGEQVEEVIAELKANGTFFLPPPMVVEWTDAAGETFYQTADNRRVVIAQQAGLKTIPAIVYAPSDKISSKESTRFSMTIQLRDDTTREIFAENWGEAVRYRSFAQGPFYPATGSFSVPTSRSRSGDCPIVDCLVEEGPNYFYYGIIALLIESCVVPGCLAVALQSYTPLPNAIAEVYQKRGLAAVEGDTTKRLRKVGSWLKRLLPPPSVMMIYIFALQMNDGDELSVVGWGLIMVFVGYFCYAGAIIASDKTLKEETTSEAWGLVFLQALFGTLSMAVLGGRKPISLFVDDQYYPLLRWAYVVFLTTGLIVLMFLTNDAKSNKYRLNLLLADSYHKMSAGMPSGLYLLGYGLNIGPQLLQEKTFVFCSEDEAIFYSSVYVIVLFIVVLMAMLEVYSAVRYYHSSISLKMVGLLAAGLVVSVTLHIGFIITLYRRPITCMTTDATEFANWFIAIQSVAFAMTVVMRFIPVAFEAKSDDKNLEMK